MIDPIKWLIPLSVILFQAALIAFSKYWLWLCFVQKKIFLSPYVFVLFVSNEFKNNSFPVLFSFKSVTQSITQEGKFWLMTYLKKCSYIYRRQIQRVAIVFSRMQSILFQSKRVWFVCVCFGGCVGVTCVCVLGWVCVCACLCVCL